MEPRVEPRDEPTKLPGGSLVVEGARSNEIGVVIESFDRPDDEFLCKADAPSIVIYDESADGKCEVLDVVSLEARALAFAWADPRTLVVLDAGGHVSLWHVTACRS